MPFFDDFDRKDELDEEECHEAQLDVPEHLKEKPAQEELPSHLHRLLKIPLLNAEQEVEMATLAQAGCEYARTRLVEANLRLVVSVAKQYRHGGVPIEDLIQEGVIGLLKAIARFDVTRGFRFSTYATHWIRQSVIRAVDCTASAIRLPTHAVESLRKIERTKQTMTRGLGREPKTEELAARLKMSRKKVERLTQIAREPLSLDQVVNPDGNLTLLALLEDPSIKDPEELAINRAWLAELSAAISTLSEREQWAVRRRIGIEEQEDPECQPLQLSRERIRQLEVQALKKLRQWARKNHMSDWLAR
ncbi:MAG: RNA polymerase sigma factor RpoD/SigA [Armatimonadetes bacterium]|nr:RNA polymerase sigma factor RpoD/SigA [Armatimonadota bacterium]